MEERIYIHVATRLGPQTEVRVVSSEEDLKEIQEEWMADFKYAIWITDRVMLISNVHYPKEVNTENKKKLYDFKIVTDALAGQVLDNTNNVK